MLSDYLKDVPMSRTHKVYAGVPLAGITREHRGTILERAVKRVMEQMTGLSASLPTEGKCINGRKRGRNAMEHDFNLDQRRVEVKSAQLVWNDDNRCWHASWQNIKQDKHDVLLLVLYSPFGLRIFEHDGTFGVSTNGQRQAASGGKVRVYSPRNQESIVEAHKVIVDKLDHMSYASVSFGQN